MQIPILVEPLEGGRWRATAGAPFTMATEGESRLEAFQNLERMILGRLRSGAAFLALDVPQSNPQLLACGTAREDDPLFREWLEIIAENRRTEDAETP